jgi:hypothetical protein
MDFLHAVGVKIVAALAGVTLLFGGVHMATVQKPSAQPAAVATAVQQTVTTPQTSTTPAASVKPTPTTQTLAVAQSQPLVSQSSGVSESELQNKLNNLENKLTSLIYQTTSGLYGGTPASPVTNSIASGGVWNSIAVTNKIDHLSNITVSGVSGLTASDIPSLPYLSTSGGTLSGLLNLTIASTTLFSAYGPAYFGATATSSFDSAGALTLASALTVPNGGTGWATINSGSILFGNGSSGLATSSNLFWDNTNSRLGVGTTTPGASIAIQDTSATSTALVGTEQVTDGGFTTDPSVSWTLGSGWTWDSGNSRAQYSGTGGPISSISVDTGGTGYITGDTVTISTGSADATYTVTASNGVVTSLTQASAGTSYTAGNGKATTGGTGTGLVVSITRISNGTTLSQTLPTPTLSTYYSASYDSWITGATYQVSFSIRNYSGSGQVRMDIGTVSSQTQLPYDFRQNGDFTVTLTSGVPVITFTPTADFVGEITDVSVKPITPSAATVSVADTAGEVGFEIRAGRALYGGSGLAPGLTLFWELTQAGIRTTRKKATTSQSATMLSSPI